MSPPPRAAAGRVRAPVTTSRDDPQRCATVGTPTVSLGARQEHGWSTNRGTRAPSREHRSPPRLARTRDTLILTRPVARWRPAPAAALAIVRSRHRTGHARGRSLSPMPSYTTADIRNVLLAGHGGSGKTTLVDALLHAAGAVNRRASVVEGNSFSDFEKEEKEHKHSIYSSVLYCDHLGKRINLIDCPGSPDLIGAALACMPAVETVVIVVNAVSGIEVVTRRMFEAAMERNLPRAIVINKIDSPEVDLDGLVSRIQETFGHECLPINLPTGNGKAVVETLLN